MTIKGKNASVEILLYSNALICPSFGLTLLYTADVYEMITVFALMHVNVGRQATQHSLIAHYNVNKKTRAQCKLFKET